MFSFFPDCETALIRPGRQAPELVCTAYVIGDGEPDVVDARRSIDVFAQWLTSTTGASNHNMPFDLAVFCAAEPDLLPEVLGALDADRITCTQVREQLITIATGTRKFTYDREGNAHRTGLHLADLAKKYVPALAPLDKGLDSWRYKYWTLRDVPIEHWPAEAIAYPKMDAYTTRLVHRAQDAGPPEFLRDQFRQTRAAFALQLMSVWGMRTDARAVRELEGMIEAARDVVAGRLIDAGLVRAKDGSKDTKAAKRLMVEACRAAGREVPMTDVWLEAQVMPDGSRIGGKKAKLLDPYDCVSMTADNCDAVAEHSPMLSAYSEYVHLGTVLSKDIPMLTRGIEHPIHSRYAIAETGRSTSSNPNTQNFSKEGGIRECVVARPGKVILQVDCPGLELHTLAECCMLFVGRSNLATMLRSGIDVHSYVGATFLGIAYEEFEPKKKGEFKKWRDTAKPFNFGCAGGMGEERFTDYARAQYGVTIEPGTFKPLKKKWIEALPEMVDYFAFARRRLPEVPEGQKPKCSILHPYSERIRGNVGYTDACNSPFQALGADITKAVSWRLVRECYADPTSPLFGARVVNYVHDEWLIEIDEDGFEHERAERLLDVVLDESSKWLQHAPFRRDKFEPVLMRRWAKDAKTVRDAYGRLQVWEG